VSPRTASGPISPRGQRDPNLEPFQLRIVSAASATEWWKVLCRGCETVRAVRERLVKATAAKGATRLYYNGAALEENFTLDKLGLGPETIVSTGRTQSVIFGNKGREKAMNDAAVAVTPRDKCCPRPASGAAAPSAATATVPEPPRRPSAAQAAAADTKAKENARIAEANRRGKAVTAPTGVTHVRKEREGAAAVSSFLHNRSLKKNVWSERVAEAEAKEAAANTQAAKAADEPGAHLPRRCLRKIKTPTVPLDMDLFAVDVSALRT